MQRYFLGIEIEINHQCNLACSYCPNSIAERKSKGFMSLDNFKLIINQLKDINYEGKICYHFFNEPLLHPQLETFVEISKKILPKTRSEIFTNGLLLTEEKYFALRHAGVDKFTVTKHESTPKIIFDETFKKLPDEEKKHVNFLDHTSLNFSSRGGLVAYGKEISGPLKRICLVPTCSVVVSVEGNVLTCFEDYLEKNVMGNIFSEHIKDIWIKAQYQQFREDLKSGHRNKHQVCQNCNNFQVM